MTFDPDQDEMERLQQQGGSAAEQEQIMAAHERDMQNLTNRMEADRLRMQGNLQERLRKKRAEKLSHKQGEVQDNMEENSQGLADRQRSQMDRLRADEVRIHVKCYIFAKKFMYNYVISGKSFVSILTFYF